MNFDPFYLIEPNSYYVSKVDHCMHDHFELDQNSSRSRSDFFPRKIICFQKTTLTDDVVKNGHATKDEKFID